MNISQRLRAVTAEISGVTLADIGTDHGYVAIDAVREGRVERAVACDINIGPLLRAEANVRACGFEERIDIRLGGGLAPVKPGEADCISIAGMGGMLMVDILREGGGVMRAADRLVLQPQLDVPQVRRFVQQSGFRIANERMLYEGRFYTVLRCERGRGAEYTPAEYAFGKILIDNKDATLRRYLEKRLSECEKILRVYENPDIRRELVMCGEVLRCF